MRIGGRERKAEVRADRFTQRGRARRHGDLFREVPHAFVVLKAPATAEDLMTFVAGRVAHYKRIRRLDFIDAIPKSPSGKILRRLLRDRPVVRA